MPAANKSGARAAPEQDGSADARDDDNACEKGRNKRDEHKRNVADPLLHLSETRYQAFAAAAASGASTMSTIAGSVAVTP